MFTVCTGKICRNSPCAVRQTPDSSHGTLRRSDLPMPAKKCSVAWVVVLLAGATTFGQRTGYAPVGGIGGVRGGVSGIHGGSYRGRSGVGSGAVIRGGPVLNPRGSLSTHEVLNPAGSVSAGQVLNPEPSLLRPRSGGTVTSNWASGRLDRPLSNRPRSTMSGPQRRPTLHQEATGLRDTLEQLRAGGDGKPYLRRDDLSRLVKETREPLDAETARQLRGILEKCEALAADEHYETVSGSRAFQAVRLVLHAYLAADVARQRGKLMASWQQLDSALGRFTTGAAWKSFLELPEGALLSSSHDVPGHEELSVSLVQKSLKRYDHVATDPKYYKITRLPEFQRTHHELADYVDRVAGPNASPVASRRCHWAEAH